MRIDINNSFSFASITVGASYTFGANIKSSTPQDDTKNLAARYKITCSKMRRIL